MRFFISSSALLIVSLLSVAEAVQVQIPLTPADVIGGSGSYSGVAIPNAYNVGQFNATQILDNQTGTVTEPVNDQHGYWINPDGGPANAYIVVDLGAQQVETQIDLFNTHNAQYNDRGTGKFQIVAGNAVVDLGGGNFDITGPTTVILKGTMAASGGDPIADQSFGVTYPGEYRYLKFEPLSVAAAGTPCCGANNYGLNEMRVFTPEPSSLVLGGLGALGLAGCAVRRRRAA